MSYDNGATAGQIPFNLPEWMAISAFTAIAWYNVLQLNVSIFLTFRRRRGLYFWSLLVSGYGVIFHSTGFLVKLFALSDNEYLACTLITIGWWPMVTGQSLVLYSRLHLVVKEEKILRGVLAMICWNAVTLHIPTTVFTYGSNSPAAAYFINGFQVMEKIQMTIFSLQELIISAIYLWAAFRLLKPVYRRRIRSVMIQLLWVNFIMVGMDISILTMEYLNNYAVEATLKSMIYAIKLVLEFAVLNQLMRLANSTRTTPEINVVAGSCGSRNADNDASQANRSTGRVSRILVPRHLLREKQQGSVASHSGERPRRISSIAEQTAEPDTPPSVSSLFENRPKDGLPPPRAGRPSLVDAFEEKANTDHRPSIINNPAAFVPQRPRPSDPLGLDDLVPTPLQSEFPDAHTTNSYGTGHPRWESGGDPSHNFPMTGDFSFETGPSDRLPMSDRLSMAEAETDLELGIDPKLLRPRRLSVSDWAPASDDASGDAEVGLGVHTGLSSDEDDMPSPVAHARLIDPTDATARPWLSAPAIRAAHAVSSSGQAATGAPPPVTRPEAAAGGTNLEFVTSAV